MLETISQRISRDPKGSGFAGRVALGVKSAASTTWLVISCGERCHTEWARWFPEDHDAALGFDEAAASALLAGEAPPDGALCVRTGDEALLRRFVDRYFGHTDTTSLLGLRLQLASR